MTVEGNPNSASRRSCCRTVCVTMASALRMALRTESLSRTPRNSGSERITSWSCAVNQTNFRPRIRATQATIPAHSAAPRNR